MCPLRVVLEPSCFGTWAAACFRVRTPGEPFILSPKEGNEVKELRKGLDKARCSSRNSTVSD